MSILRTFSVLVTLVVFPQMLAAQTVLQPQSREDFSRILSPGLISRTLTPEKLKLLKEEASKDCFSPDAFQRAVPALLPTQVRPLPCAPQNAFDRFVMWNEIALDTTAIDHAPPPPGVKADPALHNLGPHRSSRAMAIVHVAIYDAINMAKRFNENDPTKPAYLFETYSKNLPMPKRAVSVDMAITYAAAETLKWLYKEQSSVITDFIHKDERAILNGKDGDAPFFRQGRELGIAVAKSVLNARKDDGSNHSEPQIGDEGFPLSEEIGKWRPDPVSSVITALGGKWASVKPFVIGKNISIYRPPPPPDTSSAHYAKDFAEVKDLGGENTLRSPSKRTDEQTEIGIFWAYDGTAFLCAPPRLYNQIIRQLVQQKTKEMRANNEDPKLLNYARLFAMANLAMADAAIVAWDAKYHYRYWRPVVGIRAGLMDGNDATDADFYWKALGAPASNSTRGPNFTPPFPSYPSGHAVFGGALMDVIRNYFPEDTSFDFTSDEFNGKNAPAGSTEPRKRITRHFDQLRQVEDENAKSRVYLGVHWQFDADAGVAQGNQVGSFVAAQALRCLTATGQPIDCKPDGGLEIADKFLISTEKRVLSTPFRPQ